MKKLSLFAATTLLFIVMLCFSVSATNNNAQTAVNITLGKEITQTFNSDTYERYFKFVPTSTGYYEFYVKNFVPDNTYISVYNKNGDPVNFTGWNQFTNECYTVNKLTANKTYYFAVDCYFYEGSKKTTIGIKKHSHKLEKEWYFKATVDSSGYYCDNCTRCDYYKDVTVPYIKTCKFSDNRFGYNGKTYKPSLVIKDSKGKTLIKNTDYTVSGTTSAKSIGTYSIKIKFKGSYSGTKTLKYEIVPSKPKNVKFSSSTTSSVTITWDKVKGATGYTVFEYDNGYYTKAASVKTNKATIKKLDPAWNYKYVVRAYTKTEKETVRSSYSAVVNSITKPLKPEDFTVKGGNGYAKLEWYDDYGCYGYQVYMSTKKDGTYTKIKSLKSGDETDQTTKITNLTSGKTYYFKVRGYEKNNGNIAYGEFTSVKSAKIK